MQQAVKITFGRAPAVKRGSAVEQRYISALDIRLINDSFSEAVLQKSPPPLPPKSLENNVNDVTPAVFQR